MQARGARGRQRRDASDPAGLTATDARAHAAHTTHSRCARARSEGSRHTPRALLPGGQCLPNAQDHSSSGATVRKQAGATQWRALAAPLCAPLCAHSPHPAMAEKATSLGKSIRSSGETDQIDLGGCSDAFCADLCAVAFAEPIRVPAGTKVRCRRGRRRLLLLSAAEWRGEAEGAMRAPGSGGERPRARRVRSPAFGVLAAWAASTCRGRRDTRSGLAGRCGGVGSVSAAPLPRPMAADGPVGSTL